MEEYYVLKSKNNYYIKMKYDDFLTEEKRIFKNIGKYDEVHSLFEVSEIEEASKFYDLEDLSQILDDLRMKLTFYQDSYVIYYSFHGIEIVGYENVKEEALTRFIRFTGIKEIY